MKRIILASLLAGFSLVACNSAETEQEGTAELNNKLDNSTAIKEASVSFAEGGATNSGEYYSGLVSCIVEIDVKLREIIALDEQDATEKQILAVLDETISKVQAGRKSIGLYADRDWPKRAEFHTLTEKWFTTVEDLVNNHYRPMAEPMSRSMDTWTDEELAQYEVYLAAFDTYLDVDNEWIDFQEEYAAANEFTLEGTIDEEAMMEEELTNIAE